MARLVLVHGAFAGAWCWEPVTPGLERAGHMVEALDLPGAGEDRTPVAEVTLDAYASRVCDVLAGGPPAVLVAHSMGGMSATQAAARMPERLAALIYVAAFIPADGESLFALSHRPEAADDEIQANLVVSGEPPVAELPEAAARDVIYGECEDEQARWALAHRRSQPVAPMAEAFTLPADTAAAFAALPRAYITCLRDRSLPPAIQRFMFERAGCDPVIEIDTDHGVYLSRTGELVGALDQLARGLAGER